MKIAVTYEDGRVFQHFGHTAQFKLYTVEDGKIVSEAVVDTNGNGHGALAGFLESLGVNVLICGSHDHNCGDHHHDHHCGHHGCVHHE